MTNDIKDIGQEVGKELKTTIAPLQKLVITSINLFAFGAVCLVGKMGTSLAQKIEPQIMHVLSDNQAAVDETVLVRALAEVGPGKLSNVAIEESKDSSKRWALAHFEDGAKYALSIFSGKTCKIVECIGLNAPHSSGKEVLAHAINDITLLDGTKVSFTHKDNDVTSITVGNCTLQATSTLTQSVPTVEPVPTAPTLQPVPAA